MEVFLLHKRREMLVIRSYKFLLNIIYVEVIDPSHSCCVIQFQTVLKLFKNVNFNQTKSYNEMWLYAHVDDYLSIAARLHGSWSNLWLQCFVLMSKIYIVDVTTWKFTIKIRFLGFDWEFFLFSPSSRIKHAISSKNVNNDEKERKTRISFKGKDSPEFYLISFMLEKNKSEHRNFVGNRDASMSKNSTWSW